MDVPKWTSKCAEVVHHVPKWSCTEWSPRCYYRYSYFTHKCSVLWKQPSPPEQGDYQKRKPAVLNESLGYRKLRVSVSMHKSEYVLWAIRLLYRIQEPVTVPCDVIGVWRHRGVVTWHNAEQLSDAWLLQWRHVVLCQGRLLLPVDNDRWWCAFVLVIQL